MMILKPSSFLRLTVLAVTVSVLASCLNDPTPKSSPPSVNSSGTTVDPGYIGAYPSLAAAPDGRLHASYYAKFDSNQPGGGALRHAVMQDGVWRTDTIDGNVYDPAVDVGRFTSIAPDVNGGIHIAYWDVTNANLKYAVLPAGSTTWQTEIVADLSEVCEDADLKINAGIVYIGYCDGRQILLASKAIGAAGWSAGQGIAVLSASSPHAKVSLEFDAANSLHAAFFDPVATQIRYTVRPPGGSFQPSELVASPDSNETRMDLTLDAGGLPHVVFYDLVQNMVMHAYKTGTVWTTPKILSRVGDLSTSGDGSRTTYLQISSLIDHRGRLRISYYQGIGGDFGEQDLKHMVLFISDGEWAIETIETVDAAGDVGRTSAIAEDASGTIHIIYRDTTNDDLKYTYIQ